MTTDDHHIRGNRLTRSLRPVRLAGRAAVRWAGTYTAFGEKRQQKREQFVLRTADDVTQTMGNMKGAFMKLGQVLSVMEGVLPPEMREQLATLQADAPPMSYELVESVFQREFGASATTLFRSFDPIPVAAASIGQVHRAVMHDGSLAAVKVQYPGVKEAIDHDIDNFSMFIPLAGLMAPGADVSKMASELIAGLHNELDYLREAEWQQRFAERFDGHPFARVPRVHRDLTTSHVLTQEFIEGSPFAAALKMSQDDRDRIAEIIFRYCFGSIYRYNLFNGDPHPGNYILCDDGRVAFVDYGCIVEFDDATIAKFVAIIRSILDRNHDAWRAAVEDAGILQRNAPFTTDELWDHMQWYWAPILEDDVTFTPNLAAEMIARNTATTGLGGRINKYCNVPEGMVYLTRINFGLAGVLASLNAKGPWRAIVREYIDNAPPATALGRASAAATGKSI